MNSWASDFSAGNITTVYTTPIGSSLSFLVPFRYFFLFRVLCGRLSWLYVSISCRIAWTNVTQSSLFLLQPLLHSVYQPKTVLGQQSLLAVSPISSQMINCAIKKQAGWRNVIVRRSHHCACAPRSIQTTTHAVLPALIVSCLRRPCPIITSSPSPAPKKVSRGLRLGNGSFLSRRLAKTHYSRQRRRP